MITHTIWTISPIKTVSSCVVQIVRVITNQGSSNPNCLNKFNAKNFEFRWGKLFSAIYMHLTPVSWHTQMQHWLAVSQNDSGSHLFYAKLWTAADQKPMVKKIWKNMKNHGMVCPPPQNQKRIKTLRDPTIITFPHFLRTLGVVSTSNVPSYKWSSWQLRTRWAASVRMFDHKRERCTVCSQCASLVSTSHRFSLMKKVSFVVSRHFNLILSREIMVPGPSGVFLTNW